MSLSKWITRSVSALAATLAFSCSAANAFVGIPAVPQQPFSLSGAPGCALDFGVADGGSLVSAFIFDTSTTDSVALQVFVPGSQVVSNGGGLPGISASSCFGSFSASFSVNNNAIPTDGSTVPPTFADAFEVELISNVTLAAGVTGTGALAGIPTGVPVDITVGITSSMPGDPNGAPVTSITFATVAPPVPNPPGVSADLTEW